MNPTTPASTMLPVTLDDPDSETAGLAGLGAVEQPGHAVTGLPDRRHVPRRNEPNQVDAWISAYAEPFYIRA